MLNSRLWFGLAFSALFVSGCAQTTVDPAIAAARDRFSLATEPDSQTLSEVAALIGSNPEGDDATGEDDQAVTVKGRVFSGELDPWEPGKATFILSELPEDGHGEGHDADNCPFCKRRAAQLPTAIVTFNDKHNRTLAIDVRELFEIEKNQVVVIQGTASPSEFNTINLVATGIHVIGSTQ